MFPLDFPMLRRKASVKTSPLPERLNSLKKFAARHNVKIRDYSLLDLSLTHTSYVNEHGKIGSNQRLEYLGDSVLGLSINQYLYLTYPDYDEGQLARLKSHLVSESTLARIARKIRLGDVLLLGRGEEKSGGNNRSSNVADALEALLGAVYLDGGFMAADKLIMDLFKEELFSMKKLGRDFTGDPKSTLQQHVQKKYHEPPVYEILSETGPDHSKTFVCRVLINGEEVSRGKGSSHKRAEQDAADEALERLGLLNDEDI